MPFFVFLNSLKGEPEGVGKLSTLRRKPSLDILSGESHLQRQPGTSKDRRPSKTWGSLVATPVLIWGIMHLTYHPHSEHSKAVSIAKAEEAGAPVRIVDKISENALIEAAHRLSIVIGQPISVADYQEAADLLFSELLSEGLESSRPAKCSYSGQRC
jgi:hypothetical protein